MNLTPKTTKTPNTTPKGQWIRLKHPSRPEVFEAFAKWMAFPKKARDPKTQQEFARLHEVSPDTLSDYKKKESFWMKVELKKVDIQLEITDAILLSKMFDKEV